MPSKTEKQRKAMMLALAIKKGKIPKSKVNKSVQHMAESMTKKQLSDFASSVEKSAYMRSEQKKEDDRALAQYLKYLNRLGV